MRPTGFEPPTVRSDGKNLTIAPARLHLKPIVLGTIGLSVASSLGYQDWENRIGGNWPHDKKGNSPHPSWAPHAGGYRSSPHILWVWITLCKSSLRLLAECLYTILATWYRLRRSPNFSRRNYDAWRLCYHSFNSFHDAAHLFIRMIASSLVTNAFLCDLGLEYPGSGYHQPQICECFVADPRHAINYDSVDGWGDIPPTHWAIHILSLGRSTSVPGGITNSFMSKIVYDLIGSTPS